MPIIKFYGMEEKKFTQLQTQVEILSKRINASKNAIIFINNESHVLEKNKIYIEVDWLARPIELREEMVKYLLENLKTQDNEVCINFTDINNNYYVNGILKK